MANYATLKAAIADVIKTNGTNAITGEILQQSLLSMINSLGAGYQFMGVATPTTNPGTPDQNVFYIAFTPGTYSNFENFVVGDGQIAVFTYNGTWNKTAASFLDAIGQYVNKFSIVVEGSAGSYGQKNVHLFAGRRYYVSVENQVGVGDLKDENNSVVQYLQAGTYNKTFIFTRDVYSVNQIYGNGSKVTITPIDGFPAQVFKMPIVHTDKVGCNCFIEEIVLLGEYDSARIQFDVDNKWIKIFGTKDGTEIALTGYFSLSSMVSNVVLPFGSDAGYIIVNKDYFPTNGPGTVALLNFTPDYNPRIKETIDTTGLLREKPGINLISSLDWGKGISSGGGIISNASWATTFAITNKIYFGDNDYITCNNCSFGQGFYGALYDAADNFVALISPTQNVMSVQKTGNAVYARFTVTNTLGYQFMPQAQVGAERIIITPPEPYSEIGGYIPQKVFYCGPNRPYTTLKSAIEAATSVMNGLLYVDSGIYDLIQEFGSEYFDSLTSTSDLAGLKLRNRVHIIFSPNAIVKCHYTGNNEWVMKQFSPFNAGEYGFTIENLKLEASRTRYAIHDEYASNPELCQSKYINCYFKFDNSNNPYWGETIIGGGLGRATEVDIQGCTFDCVNNGNAIYYHQAAGDVTDYSSVINVKNNYVIRGKVDFDFSKQNANNPTYIHFSNNSVPANADINADGLYLPGTSYDYNIIYAWNNIIRS